MSIESLSPQGPESAHTVSPELNPLSLPTARKAGARRCSATTHQAVPCRAWAVRDTNPPLCSAHAGRSVGAGAPLRNQNRTTHGFYSLLLSPEEAAELSEMGSITSLEQEIGCARIALRRVMRRLADPPADLHPFELVRLAHLVFSGTRTLARLVRDQSDLAGIPDPLRSAIGQALDEIGEELGVPLLGETGARPPRGIDD